MPRPVNADAAATRQRILAASLQLFSEQGVEGTSIRKIAGASGVSLAMVHHYFGSKEALHKACTDQMYAEMDALRVELADALRGGGEPRELVDRLVRSAWRFARDHARVMRLLMRSVMAAGELAEDYRERAQKPFLEQLPGAVAALLGRPVGDLRLTLQSVVNILVRYAICTERELAAFTGIKDDPDGAERAVEDHLVHASHALLGVA